MKRYVLGALFQGDHVVLVRKARPEWQAGRYNLPGGHVEPGEIPYDAIVREFREETGLSIPKWRPFAGLHYDRDTRTGDGEPWTLCCFTAALSDHRLLVGTPDEPVAWHRYDDLPPRILPHLAWLVPMARQALTLPLFAEVRYP